MAPEDDDSGFWDTIKGDDGDDEPWKTDDDGWNADNHWDVEDDTGWNADDDGLDADDIRWDTDDDESNTDEEPEEEGAKYDGEEEMGPAEDYGFKLGVPLALLTAYLVFIGPEPAIQLSQDGGEVFSDPGSGAKPFLNVATVTLVATFAGGLIYPMVGGEIYEDYKMDLAVNSIILPALVFILLGALIILDPAFVDLLNGNISSAVGWFVIASIVTVVLLYLNIGKIAVIIIFGVYLGIPSFVGSYTGTSIGSLVRR